MKIFCSSIIYCIFFLQIHATEFQICDIGLLESNESDAFAIDEEGTIYGTYKIQESSYDFIWNKFDGLHETNHHNNSFRIETDTFVSNIHFQKMNANRQSIYSYGEWIRNDNEKFKLKEITRKAYLKDKNNAFIDLGSLGGTYTCAYDLNDLGQVVGCSKTKDGKLHAFLWENGKMIDLGTMSGDLGILSDTSSAVSINNSGQIVGNSKYTLVHKGNIIKTLNRAFLWENGRMVNLPPEHHVDTGAQGIMDNGIIFMHDGQNYMAFNTKTNSSEYIPGCPKKIKGNLVHLGDYIYDYSNEEYPKKIVSLTWWDILNLDSTHEYNFIKSVNVIDFNQKKQIIVKVKNIYEEPHIYIIEAK